MLISTLLDILALDILGLDILGLDILGLDILGMIRLDPTSGTPDPSGHESERSEGSGVQIMLSHWRRLSARNCDNTRIFITVVRTSGA